MMKRKCLCVQKTVWGGVNSLRLTAVIVSLCAALGTAVAQTGSAQLDVSRLTGADPADIINTDNTNRAKVLSDVTARSKTFMLLNVGTEKFFDIGGAYGRHATLSSNGGMNLWIFGNSSTSGTYNIRTRQNAVKGNSATAANMDNADSYVQYLDNDARRPGVYPDCQPTDASRAFGWKFEQAEGYSATNKVYKLSTYGGRYLTALPDATDGNLCDAVATVGGDNQVWKLVTLEDYYNLYDKSPSSLSSPIDISFLGHNLDFGYNKSDNTGWLIYGPSGNGSYAFSGTTGYSHKFTDANYTGNNVNDAFLYENGKYFCGWLTKISNGGVYQPVYNITKPGKYIIRCNGFSNTNGRAKLAVSHSLRGFNTLLGLGLQITGEVALQQLPSSASTDVLEAGKAFSRGEYENEIVVKITEADIKEMENAFGTTTCILFGIYVEGTGSDTDLTAFGNFRILYAGDDPDAPELVLDEDNPDMRYLTETVEDYTNTTLHLNRSFSTGKWNTLILPVSLTYGQMKEAFGTDVLLAELHELTASSVRFMTVDCDDDSDVMLTAYTPYIIKPTKAADTNDAYTTPRLKKAANRYWLGEGESITYDGDANAYYTGGQATAAANHYTIPGVTLDRTLLTTAFDKHWVSATVTNASANDMVCKGTMAKTYYVTPDKKGAFYTDDGEARDNLAGDYFMNKGEMWKVPSVKQYGLKAFRCWFELTGDTDTSVQSTAPAKDVRLYIDEVADNTTSLNGVSAGPASPQATPAACADGVYNIYGQRVRNGSSLDGLPKGIYIVKGKKMNN